MIKVLRREDEVEELHIFITTNHKMFSTIFNIRPGRINENLNFIGTIRRIIVLDVSKQNVGRSLDKT